MVIGQATIFHQKHSNGTPVESYVILAWHWKWSLTWRWILDWSPYYKLGRRKFHFMRTNKGFGFNFRAGINLPVLGHIMLQTQPNMKL